MITEPSLREALLVEAADAAPVDLAAVARHHDDAVAHAAAAIRVPGPRVVAPGRSAHRLPRRVAVGLTAAAVAAVVVVTVTTVVTTRDHRPTTAGAAAPAASGRSTGFDVSYWNALVPVPGLTVVSRTLRAQRQSIVFGASSTSALGTVTRSVARVDVYARGAFDPTAVRDGDPVSIGTIAAYRAVVPVQLFDGVPGSTASVPVLAWQWADGAWAVAAGTDPAHRTVDIETSLVRAIVPGDAPVRVPVAFSAMPAGLVRSSVTVEEDPGSIRSYRAEYQRVADTPADAPAAYSVTVTLAGASAGPAPEEESTTPAADPTDPVPQAGMVAGGVTYTISTVHLSGFTTIYVNAPTSPLTVQIEVADSVSSAVDVRWAQFVPAALDDPTSWPAATVALP